MAPPTTSAPPSADAPAGIRARAAPHWPFLVLFTVGFVLRVATSLAYRPALLYIDSVPYLYNVGPLDPARARPVGYSVILRPLTAAGELWVVPVVQHGIGLAMAVGIYALLTRAGARRWVATAATAPVLLDAYQLQIEQNILSETFFQALVLGGIVLLVDGAGRARPLRRRLVTAALAGLLLGLAVPVRVIGQFLVVPAVAYLLVEGGRRIRVRALVALVWVAAFAVPVVGTMAYYAAWTGEYALSPISGRVMYGRAAVIVDCDGIDIPPSQRALCPDEPRDARLKIDNYVWNIESPINRHDPPPGMTRDESLGDFAVTVFRQQPVEFASGVVTDMAKNLWWTRRQFPGDVDVGRWHFTETYPDYGANVETVRAYGGQPRVQATLAAWLRAYQLSVGYTPGTLLGVMLVVGMVAAAGIRRARGSPLRAACGVWTLAAAMLLFLPAAFEFSWRYLLPALVLAPVAGGLGATALFPRSPR